MGKYLRSCGKGAKASYGDLRCDVLTSRHGVIAHEEPFHGKPSSRSSPPKCRVVEWLRTD